MAATACGTRIHIATEPVGEGGPAATDPLSVQLRLSPAALEVVMSNLGTEPVDVHWDRSSIVDIDGTASALVHSESGAFPAEGLGVAVSRILPLTTLDAYVLPMRHVSFTPGGRWVAAPMLPIECGPLRCVGYRDLVGKTLRLSLATRTGGADHVYEWTLRITRTVLSIHGTRPTDPDLR